MNQGDERNSLVPHLPLLDHLGEITFLRPIFGRGVAQRRLGAEVPELHQKFPLSLGAMLKTDSPKNVAFDPPPPP